MSAPAPRRTPAQSPTASHDDRCAFQPVASIRPISPGTVANDQKRWLPAQNQSTADRHEQHISRGKPTQMSDLVAITHIGCGIDSHATVSRQSRATRQDGRMAACGRSKFLYAASGDSLLVRKCGVDQRRCAASIEARPRNRVQPTKVVARISPSRNAGS